MLVIFFLQSILTDKKETTQRDDIASIDQFIMLLDKPYNGSFDIIRVKERPSFKILYLKDDLQFQARDLQHKASVSYSSTEPLCTCTQDFSCASDSSIQANNYLPLEGNLASNEFHHSTTATSFLSLESNFYHGVENLFSFLNYSIFDDGAFVGLMASLNIERKYLNKVKRTGSTVQFEVSLNICENYTSVYLSVPYKYVQEKGGFVNLVSVIQENPIKFFSYFRCMYEKYQENSYFVESVFFNNFEYLLEYSQTLDFDDIKFSLSVLTNKNKAKQVLDKTISIFSSNPPFNLESLYMNLKRVLCEVFENNDERLMLKMFQDICNLFIYTRGDEYEQKVFYDFIFDQEYKTSENHIYYMRVIENSLDYYK
ncbi:hypothetical protein NGRA_2683 [Nosema granulosis]|uniref:Uncharacterized protein n=1 Tax=Nosema granulosis TaxID=83296 RepID=A0A9P6KYE0_9MICR|nr:hypothetical protein NGRA_2683 [Nosema granulosis]